MSKTITGIAANHLIADGIVCIINEIKDFHKFKPGNIIVTKETLPDYFPLMIKSNGVITDAGGLLSHASVVAREINIPCIVGTKTATTILKDGDFVRIDGKTGKIYILSVK